MMSVISMESQTLITLTCMTRGLVYESVGGHDKAGETHELVWPSLPVAGGNVTGRYGVVDMLSTTIQRW